MEKQILLYKDGQFDKTPDTSLDSKDTLVLCFGSSDIKTIEDGFGKLERLFPNSTIVGNSTSGEIYEDLLYDDSISIAIMKFKDTKISVCKTNISSHDSSFECGVELAKNLDKQDLKSIFLLSDGLNINATQLTKGINSIYKQNILVAGGLAGDKSNFEKTWVYFDKQFHSHIVVGVGFYGDNIKFANGSQGGWKKFGKDRIITKSKDNILYELDNEPALKIYKIYLGDEAADLPSSGLLYPLMIKEKDSDESKVRTILAIDEDTQSITFAGDMPENAKAMFMKASFDELIEGAKQSAEDKSFNRYKDENGICIAISCVGRRLVLGQKSEDELEAVYNSLGSNVDMIGYYSYGEISPTSEGKCDLHNQTMTLTMIWEDA